jgi:hypothetical protein
MPKKTADVDPTTIARSMLKGGGPKKRYKLGGKKGHNIFFSDREGGCLRGLVHYLTISLGHCSRVEFSSFAPGTCGGSGNR